MSQASLRKFQENMSQMSLANKSDDKNVCTTSKSMESLYSSSSHNSKSLMLRRKSQNRHAGILSSSTEVRQRVISARLLRFKNVQNQLNDALQNLATLTNENRLLKTLHKRQDIALAKYEGTNAELPQLLNSHAEEIRVWQLKCRSLYSQNRELNQKLKQRDAFIEQLNEQNKHLTQLNADKNLEQRETLSGKVHYLQLRLAEKDEELKRLEKRNLFETKNLKTQLCNEQKKYKELCQKMEKLPVKPRYGSSHDSERSSAIDSQEAKHDEILFKANNSILPRHTQLNRQKEIESLISADRFSKETPTKSFSNGFITNSRDECLIHNNTQLIPMLGKNNANPNEKNVGHGPDASDEDNKELPSQRISVFGHVDDDEDDEDLIIKTIKETDTDPKDLDESLLTQRFADVQIVNANAQSNIFEIHNKINEDIRKNEVLLDRHCEEISKDTEVITRAINLPSCIGNGNAKSRFNINVRSVGGPNKRPPIDPQKKSKLLAALKSIDSANDQNNDQ